MAGYRYPYITEGLQSASTPIYKGMLVALDGDTLVTENQAFPCNGAYAAVGVAMNDALAVGDRVAIKTEFGGTWECRVATGVSFTVGAAVYIDADGYVTPTAQGAEFYVLGYAMSAAAAGSLVEVLPLRTINSTP
jgi:predicted RecA/RadA family phage recombinase